MAQRLENEFGTSVESVPQQGDLLVIKDSTPTEKSTYPDILGATVTLPDGSTQIVPIDKGLRKPVAAVKKLYGPDQKRKYKLRNYRLKVLPNNGWAYVPVPDADTPPYPDEDGINKEVEVVFADDTVKGRVMIQDVYTSKGWEFVAVPKACFEVDDPSSGPKAKRMVEQFIIKDTIGSEVVYMPAELELSADGKSYQLVAIDMTYSELKNPRKVEVPAAAETAIAAAEMTVSNETTAIGKRMQSISTRRAAIVALVLAALTAGTFAIIKASGSHDSSSGQSGSSQSPNNTSSIH